jgi:hypothetical protein
MSRCIGIDLGLTGAVASVDERGEAQVHDIPTLPDGKSRRIDGRALILLLRQLVQTGVKPVFVIEDVRPRPNAARGTTMHSEGSLMRSRGIVEGVADIMGADLRAVQPQSVKRFFGLIRKDKNAGREVAMRLYPCVAPDIKRVRDHNRGDAILLAHFGLTRLS